MNDFARITVSAINEALDKTSVPKLYDYSGNDLSSRLLMDCDNIVLNLALAGKINAICLSAYESDIRIKTAVYAHFLALVSRLLPFADDSYQ